MRVAADSVVQSTDGVAPAERWDHWTDVALAAVDGAPLVDGADFSATRRLGRTGLGTVIHTASQPLTVERSRARIARDGLDDVCLVMMTEGRGRMDAGTRGEDALHDGDMVLFDVARPYTTTALTPYEELRLYVPRRVFAARVGRIESLAGLRIPGQGALAALFSRYLADLSAAMPSLTGPEAEAGMDGVLHLFTGLVRAQAPVPVPVPVPVPAAAGDGGGRPSRDALLALADHHIAASLGDPGLDAAALARALGVSRSRLYEAFAARGGVAAAIRDARLERVRLRSTSPGDRHRTLEEVALACGFTDYPSFTRAFRRRFGLSPRDARGR